MYHRVLLRLSAFLGIHRLAKAVALAVYLHGLAGDVMRESVGEHSMVATDLLRGLPEAFRRAQDAAQEKVVRWQG